METNAIGWCLREVYDKYEIYAVTSLDFAQANGFGE